MLSSHKLLNVEMSVANRLQIAADSYRSKAANLQAWPTWIISLHRPKVQKTKFFSSVSLSLFFLQCGHKLQNPGNLFDHPICSKKPIFWIESPKNYGHLQTGCYWKQWDRTRRKIVWASKARSNDPRQPIGSHGWGRACTSQQSVTFFWSEEHRNYFQPSIRYSNKNETHEWNSWMKVSSGSKWFNFLFSQKEFF